MKKINFQDNITKANAETMNTFQDNIENAINSLKGTVLWKNSDASSNFNAQTINIDLANYDVVEIYFSEGSSFKTEVGKQGYAYIIQDANGNFTGSPYVYLRKIQTTSTNIQFGDCLGQQTGQSGAWGTNNARLKPYYVVGYNVGLLGE